MVAFLVEKGPTNAVEVVENGSEGKKQVVRFCSKRTDEELAAREFPINNFLLVVERSVETVGNRLVSVV